MSRIVRGALVLAVLAILSGCRVQEYVVADEDVPFYATPGARESVDTMPFGHHGRVLDGDVENGRVEVRFRGTVGYAPKDRLRFVDYKHPALDEGVDRERVVGRARRELKVEREGRGWPARVRAAVIEGHIFTGMSREQVEIAWGWPRMVLPVSEGRERWIYRHRVYYDLGGTFTRCPDLTHGACWGPKWCYHAPLTLRQVVIEERVVLFSAEGAVEEVFERCYLVEEKPEDAAP